MDASSLKKLGYTNELKTIPKRIESILNKTIQDLERLDMSIVSHDLKEARDLLARFQRLTMAIKNV